MSRQRGHGTGVIAGYEVNFHRCLGRGAMGLVYLGKDQDGSTIAAKQVDRLQSDQAAIQQLVAAQKESTLDHENIVKILHIFNEEETWIFMEYLPNGNINTFSMRHYNEFQSLVGDWMLQMLRGLSYLHSKEICHRNIKPENILIQLEGSKVVKLTDFGLAKLSDLTDSTIATNIMKAGAEKYMAPELFIKKPGNKIHYRQSADIFALSLIFVAMIQAKEGQPLKPVAEGWRPEESSQAIGYTMYMRHANNQPELTVFSTSTKADQEEKDFERLFRRAISFKPDERPTAQEMLSELEAIRTRANEKVTAKQIQIIRIMKLFEALKDAFVSLILIQAPWLITLFFMFFVVGASSDILRTIGIFLLVAVVNAFFGEGVIFPSLIVVAVMLFGGGMIFQLWDNWGVRWTPVQTTMNDQDFPLIGDVPL